MPSETERHRNVTAAEAVAEPVVEGVVEPFSSTGTGANPGTADPRAPQEANSANPGAAIVGFPSPPPSSNESVRGEASEQACRCGAGPSETHDGRCARGHVFRGNTLAVVAGVNSPAFWREHDEARRTIRDAIIRDAGAPLDNPPETLALVADSIAQASLVRDSAYHRMALEGGPLSASGKARRAFVVWLRHDRLSANCVMRSARSTGVRWQNCGECSKARRPPV